MRIRAATSGKAVAVNTAVSALVPNTWAALITPNCNDLYLFDYFKRSGPHSIPTAFNVDWNINNRRSKAHTEQFQSHPYSLKKNNKKKTPNVSNRVAPGVKSKVKAVFIRVAFFGGRCKSHLRFSPTWGHCWNLPNTFPPSVFFRPETSQRVACLRSQPRLTPGTHVCNKLESFFPLAQLQEDLTLSGTRTKGRAGVSWWIQRWDSAL